MHGDSASTSALGAGHRDADAKRQRLLDLLALLDGRALAARDVPDAREALALARDSAEPVLLGRSLVYCSAALRAAGQSKEAIELGVEAVECYASIGDRANEGVAHYLVGVGLYYERRWSESLVSLERAAAISDVVGDPIRQVRCLSVIAVILGYLGNYPRSLTAYDQALALTTGDGREADRVILLNNKAQSLLHRARNATERDEAVSHATDGYNVLMPEATDLAERWAPSYSRAVRDTLGQCLLLRDLPNEALAIFQENWPWHVTPETNEAWPTP